MGVEKRIMNAINRVFIDMPDRVKALPVSDKGFPVPFFCEWIDGKPDFRIASPARRAECHRRKLCWICGQHLGQYLAFVIGPMCGINRTTAEPPQHRECAIFAARNCPFLARPEAKRNDRNMPEKGEIAGVHLNRNPGVAGVWITKSYRPFKPKAGGAGTLFNMGDPVEVLWYARSRPATREEVETSIDGGLPALFEVAAKFDGPGGVEFLRKEIDKFRPLLPPPAMAQSGP